MTSPIEQYRSLLVADETINSVDRCLDLVQAIVGTRLVFEDAELELRRIDEEQRLYERHWRKKLSNAIREYDAPEFERAKARRLIKKARVEQHARVILTSATLSIFSQQAQKVPGRPSQGRDSLLWDSLLLLFHHAYFALLPAISTAGWAKENSLLLSAFADFSTRVPSVAERYRIAALCYEARGELDEAARCYRESLWATHVDDHEFMSRLQAYWTFCVQNRRFDEAIHLLLDAYPKVQREDLDEMRELILATFQHYADSLSGAAGGRIRQR